MAERSATPSESKLSDTPSVEGEMLLSRAAMVGEGLIPEEMLGKYVSTPEQQAAFFMVGDPD